MVPWPVKAKPTKINRGRSFDNFVAGFFVNLGMREKKSWMKKTSTEWSEVHLFKPETLKVVQLLDIRELKRGHSDVKIGPFDWISCCSSERKINFGPWTFSVQIFELWPVLDAGNFLLTLLSFGEKIEPWICLSSFLDCTISSLKHLQAQVEQRLRTYSSELQL